MNSYLAPILVTLLILFNLHLTSFELAFKTGTGQYFSLLTKQLLSRLYELRMFDYNTVFSYETYCSIISITGGVLVCIHDLRHFDFIQGLKQLIVTLIDALANVIRQILLYLYGKMYAIITLILLAYILYRLVRWVGVKQIIQMLIWLLLIVLLLISLDKLFYHYYVYFTTFADCYDNLLHGGQYLLINEYAHAHGMCRYGILGFLRYYKLRILLTLYCISCISYLVFVKPNNLPSYYQMFKWARFVRRLPSQEQIVLYLTMRYTHWFLPTEHFSHFMSRFRHSFKTGYKICNILQKVNRNLEPVVSGNTNAHLYEAKCRSNVKKFLKTLLKEKLENDDNFIPNTYFDFGTKRDKFGANAYVHHGDFRYDAAILGLVMNSAIVSFDVTEHMDDNDYGTLVANNLFVYSYIPVPISRWTTRAVLKDQCIIYDQQVANGDSFVNEKFRLNRHHSNTMITTKDVDVCMTNDHITVGNHHLLRYSQATAVLPQGCLSPPKPIEERKLFGLVGPQDTLVCCKLESGPGMHIMNTKDYLVISQTTNYDRASTTNNSLKQKKDVFDLLSFALDSEFSTFIKASSIRSLTFDLRSKYPPKMFHDPDNITQNSTQPTIVRKNSNDQSQKTEISETTAKKEETSANDNTNTRSIDLSTLLGDNTKDKSRKEEKEEEFDPNQFVKNSMFTDKSSAELKQLEQNRIKNLTKTDVTIEKPSKEGNVVSLEKAVHMSPKNESNPSNISKSQAGNIAGSEPYDTPETSTIAFICRYLTKPPTVSEEYKPLISVMETFVSLAKKCMGELVPNPDLMKQKHKDIVDLTAHFGPSTIRKMMSTENFRKRECYPGGLKYFRMISNQDPNLVAKLTPFTAAVHAAASKSIPWYMPGKTQFEAAMYTNVVGIDFSSFESSQTLIFRYLEMLFGSFFGTAHCKDYLLIIQKELNTEFKFDMRTKEEKKLHAKNRAKLFFLFALALRLSGSALTTVGNTFLAAFLQFAYYHLVCKFDINKAWNCIRFCYGDDSLIADTHIDGFRKFVGKFGFVITVESMKGPSELSLVGKVLVNGKTSVDAVRALKKYLVSYGCYDFVTNIFNKWAGMFNPQDTKKNIFTLIGMEAFLRVNLSGRYTKDEYMSRLDCNSTNSTFEVAFAGDHDKLCSTFESTSTKTMKDEEFIQFVVSLLEPYITQMLPVSKLGFVTTEDGVVKQNGDFKLNSKDQETKIRQYNKMAKLINDRLNNKFMTLINRDRYMTNLTAIINHVGIKYDVEPRPRQKETLKHKPTTRTTPTQRGYGKTRSYNKIGDKTLEKESLKEKENQQKSEQSA
jgi:hypothetical protein